MRTAAEIEDLVTRAAGQQDAALVSDLVVALNDHEVFYSLDVAEVDGQPQIKTPLLELADGSHALEVFTSRANPELWKEYAGAPWRNVLELAAEIPPVQWVIIKNDAGSRVPIRKSQVAVILGILPPESATTLDARIAKIANEPQAQPFTSLESQLSESQLFVRLTPESARSGQPTLLTSSAGGVDNLVQAYTSRSRPGYVYGEMDWRAIVGLVAHTPALAGIHIVNDNDDWVIIGRSDLGLAN
ncbi:SseB family protein [Mycobacteroides abscessus]|uniref:SseB family protein n=1 Tax=Mycobacteroides abscessus TaxID=36809 RepID=UPI0005E6730B|nr:SseB family protein [Mycobacteroides abscessus]UEA47876.1 SseB family protein [Mycobacteroides abscessus subsp. abscessus]UEA52143.1 SseB family protein [Mycobacteroides abscessus]CPW81204.1 Uncharacterised protein [Mycobacteroides abscessus]SKE35136.1 Uncharacterised protein [Mycobacteroides abscessus subsp. bolletii]SKG47237.1 Uncharacterised protein [Mycobacteroides abscessus subsp. bolletii]